MKKRYIALLIILIAIVGFGIYYVTDFYHAEENIDSYVPGDVDVIKTSNGIFLDGKGNDTAVIFYPGAKVEYKSYEVMFSKLAAKGVDCYLVEMPANIAFFGANSADDIIKNSDYSHYFLAGHSLGGVAASSYVNSTNNTDGLILLAAYPTEKIEKPVLSIYGSNDKVLDLDKYNESTSLMSNLTEFVIKGGNHAQFGNYGNQSGDGAGTISWQKQQDECVNEILDFINENV